MSEDFEKPDKDLGEQIIEKAFGAPKPEILETLFSAQGTDRQRENLAKLFGGRLPVDKEK
jgi:hypothetical protein